MKKAKTEVKITKESIGYSAQAILSNKFIGTEGESLEEIKLNIIEALNLASEDEKASYSIEDIKFSFDLESFFEFYKVINAKALSERIGMNQSLLAQYIKGIKRPSTAQRKRIQNGIKQIANELSEVSLVD